MATTQGPRRQRKLDRSAIGPAARALKNTTRVFNGCQHRCVPESDRRYGTRIVTLWTDGVRMDEWMGRCQRVACFQEGSEDHCPLSTFHCVTREAQFTGSQVHESDPPTTPTRCSAPSESIQHSRSSAPSESLASERCSLSTPQCPSLQSAS